jgi:hypothetical protein
VQFHFLPVEERFYVRFTPEACAQYPEGTFSVVSNYPVYAVRLREVGGEDVTEFFIPGSNGVFLWVDMRRTYLARR